LQNQNLTLLKANFLAELAYGQKGFVVSLSGLFWIQPSIPVRQNIPGRVWQLLKQPMC